MIKRSAKIKEICDNSRAFLSDVTSEIQAMVEDMSDIV
jgi:hypothetical protein